MRHHWIFLQLLLALPLVACGKTDRHATTQGQQTNQIETVNQACADENDPKIPNVPLETRIANAARGALKCEYEGECQPAVAMISVVVKKSIERCTGFLIAPDLVMTNDHCFSCS